MTKMFLKQHNVSFVEHNIDEQPEFIERLKADGFRATPVVKLPNGDAFSGFRPDMLKQLAYGFQAEQAPVNIQCSACFIFAIFNQPKK